ncbi:HEPN domain-containing protein [Candidatus Nanohalobium constans]|uniref:HEPN domain-containing protein n=1 Tax=Candidatus Nanohalobium constans TaxID=2565781 RepID=A0A5Q0UJ07_9ARCH|nr:HEPN domain-containing protein [Candidatus Nanohalobium constans]QGA80809.1 HEPN domain-containing protein [Candidatus Nanohalobium constans]
MSEVEKNIELADNAFEDFEKGRNAGLSIRALYNRLYYACFYAARAALISQGIEAKTHSGIADRVFLVLYKEKNLISKETAATLSRVETKRNLSDYELEIDDTEEDLKEIEQKARKFVKEMNKLLD